MTNVMLDILGGGLLATWAWMAKRLIGQLDATTKLAQQTSNALEKLTGRLEAMEERWTAKQAS